MTSQCFEWAYGVTTVPSRRNTLLPRTLDSLKAGGFHNPRLLVDGSRDGYNGFGLEVTYRWPRILPYGNWVLGLAELLIRQPAARLYAIFQDDLVCCRNLRQYLEKQPFPVDGYWNLFTFPQNQELCGAAPGFYPSNQLGRGALALVFNRQGVIHLLTHQHMVERPTHARVSTVNIDGAVVSAAKKMGWTEFCHNPSLVQHTGANSSMNEFRPLTAFPLAPSFRGEEFDCLELLICQAAR